MRCTQTIKGLVSVSLIEATEKKTKRKSKQTKQEKKTLKEKKKQNKTKKTVATIWKKRLLDHSKSDLSPKWRLLLIFFNNCLV